MALDSPRLKYRGLRNVPLTFSDPELLQLAQALIQVQDRIVRYPKEVVSTTATYTMLDIDILVKVNAEDGARTVFLPTAVGREGRRAGVKKTDASDNLVLIDPNGSETIDGSASISLSQKNAYREMMSDGVNWVLTSAIGNATSL